jgi:hypothetical protein
MSLSDVFAAGDLETSHEKKKAPPLRFSPSQKRSAPSEDLLEFLWLRDETQAAMRISCDRETIWKLYNTLQEIETCIRNLQKAEASAGSD